MNKANVSRGSKRWGSWRAWWRLLVAASLALPLSQLGASAPKKPVTPAYDIFIGFLAGCDCLPLEVQFRQLSFEAVFRNIRFEFSPVTTNRRTYNWSVASLGGPALLMPIPGIMGEGEISDHDLCPFWGVDSHGKQLKATIIRMDGKTRPLITAVDRKRIPRIFRKILGNPAPEIDSEGLELEPLVPPNTFVFEFTSSIEPGQTRITLEGADATYRVDDLKFYARLPYDELLAGKDVSREFPFRHSQVGNPGTLTIRFIPAKK